MDWTLGMGISATIWGVLAIICAIVGFKLISVGANTQQLKALKFFAVAFAVMTAGSLGWLSTQSTTVDPGTTSQAWDWEHTCGDTTGLSVANNTTVTGNRGYLVTFCAAGGVLDEGTVNVDYAAWRTDTSIEGSVARAYIVSIGTSHNVTTGISHEAITQTSAGYTVAWDDGTTTFGDEMNFPADPDLRTDTLGFQFEVNPAAIAALDTYGTITIVVSVGGVQDTITLMRSDSV